MTRLIELNARVLVDPTEVVAITRDPHLNEGWTRVYLRSGAGDRGFIQVARPFAEVAQLIHDAQQPRGVGHAITVSREQVGEPPPEPRLPDPGRE